MTAFNASALVLFSGGQDSATCLAWALERYERVETIGFAYGQRHVIELACREHFLKSIQQQFPQWAHKLGQDHMLDLSLLGQISDTSLTRDVCTRGICLNPIFRPANKPSVCRPFVQGV